GGSLSLGADGSFTYTPPAGFAGAVSFTYQASDGPAISTATVIITVAAAGTVIANPDGYTTAEDTPLSVAALGVLANDQAPSGMVLSAQPIAGPARGTLTLNTDGSFGYSPPANYHGLDPVTY